MNEFRCRPPVVLGALLCAALFAPAGGYFASGFRGIFTGREQLIRLVQSERHCTAGDPPTPRPGGSGTPSVDIDLADGGVHAVVPVGSAEYQDGYTLTPEGWRFASRTVVTTDEKAAGLDYRGLREINRFGGAELVEYYEDDRNGTPRLMTVGTRISVVDGKITGRVYLKDGDYRDETYEKINPVRWRIVP